MKKSRRIGDVPPYVFARQNVLRDELLSKGVDIVDMSVGDPDLPTPAHVVERLVRAAWKPENHRYPPYEGTKSFREAVASYYRTRFGVELDPLREVMTLIGSKEGIAHLIWALVDEGDVALVPDPAYPVYSTQVKMAGGICHKLPLTEERSYRPVFEDVPLDIARRATLMVLNYPNNPTGAVVDTEFFEEASAFARDHDIVILHDGAYLDITYDGYRAPSLLQVSGSRDLLVETYSLSKPFNMTGWRIAAIAGSSEVIYEALSVIKTNLDSGQWNAIQEAGEEALEKSPETVIARNCEVYRTRRDILVEALVRAGIDVRPPAGALYLWAKAPEGYDSESFSEDLLRRCGLLVTPGRAYGEHGEGFVRFSLTCPTERVKEAARRLSTERWRGR